MLIHLNAIIRHLLISQIRYHIPVYLIFFNKYIKSYRVCFNLCRKNIFDEEFIGGFFRAG